MPSADGSSAATAATKSAAAATMAAARNANRTRRRRRHGAEEAAGNGNTSQRARNPFPPPTLSFETDSRRKAARESAGTQCCRRDASKISLFEGEKGLPTAAAATKGERRVRAAVRGCEQSRGDERTYATATCRLKPATRQWRPQITIQRAANAEPTFGPNARKKNRTMADGWKRRPESPSIRRE
ncbi:hypothetical protein V9T40_000341 [Parthenolecanium corni]|uniref:Uncharacterized protein n=1 Tax=Parthenolecanium corni TaxID=536013 RepID=A0AAN9TM75_9HEMI